MQSINSSSQPSPAPISVAVDNPMLQARLTRLQRLLGSVLEKDTAVFQERPEVQMADLISTLLQPDPYQAGQPMRANVLLTGISGIGKTILMTKTLETLREQGVSIYPENAHPIQLMILPHDLEAIEALLKAQPADGSVVVGMQEFISALDADPERLGQLMALKQKYPQLKFLVDQQASSWKSAMETDDIFSSDEEKAMLRQLFPKPIVLQPLANPLPAMVKVLGKTGFSIEPTCLSRLEGFFQRRIPQPNDTPRAFLIEVVLAMGKMVSIPPPLDENTPIELTEPILAHGFPQVFGKPNTIPVGTTSPFAQ